MPASRESQELQAMRSMAWERAKGELRSMLHTYYSESTILAIDGEEHNQFEIFDSLLTVFIEEVESIELHA